jgi:hypothetical protein
MDNSSVNKLDIIQSVNKLEGWYVCNQAIFKDNIHVFCKQAGEINLSVNKLERFLNL